MQIGSTVQLKSGGPIMTISYEIKEKEKYECQWFDEEKKLQHGTFPSASLKIFVYPTIED